MGRGEPSPGADVAAARPIADRAMRPTMKRVLAQLDATAAMVESGCRCGASRRRAGGRKARSRRQYPEGAQQLPLPQQVVLVERHHEIRHGDVPKHAVGERHGPEILGLDRRPKPNSVVLAQSEPIRACTHTHVAWAERISLWARQGCAESRRSAAVAPVEPRFSSGAAGPNRSAIGGCVSASEVSRGFGRAGA